MALLADVLKASVHYQLLVSAEVHFCALLL